MHCHAAMVCRVVSGLAVYAWAHYGVVRMILYPLSRNEKRGLHIGTPIVLTLALLAIAACFVVSVWG